MLTETIAAVSTPPGKGGVALIRISGADSTAVAERVFRAASGRTVCSYPPRTQIYGYIVDRDERVDDVLLTHFPAPASYTGEDTVEISCHGGTVVVRTVLELIFAAGARAADAGEFTRRAFINGKLSLTEAEAIGDLLEAKSREQIRLLSTDARDALGARIEEIRVELVGAMSSVYARIDYPDEDLGDLSDGELERSLIEIREKICKLISTYKTGRAVKEGIKCAICGKPNAGKSTVYNLLVGEDAAIVTDIKGTTTDVLTREIPLGKIMLSLSDTAGIRDESNAGAIERIGIEKSRKTIAECELLFAIFDASREFDSEDKDLLNSIFKSNATKIAIINKLDSASSNIEEHLGGFDDIIRISALTEPVDARIKIADVCTRLFTDERISIGHDAVISSARQYAALSRAAEYVALAIEGLASGFGQDAASSDIERAIGAVCELSGRQVSEDVTADIFSKFCVGK